MIAALILEGCDRGRGSSRPAGPPSDESVDDDLRSEDAKPGQDRRRDKVRNVVPPFRYARKGLQHHKGCENSAGAGNRPVGEERQQHSPGRVSGRKAVQVRQGVAAQPVKGIGPELALRPGAADRKFQEVNDHHRKAGCKDKKTNEPQAIGFEGDDGEDHDEGGPFEKQMGGVEDPEKGSIAPGDGQRGVRNRRIHRQKKSGQNEARAQDKADGAAARKTLLLQNIRERRRGVGPRMVPIS